MGGGTTHADHPLPQFRNTLHNFSSSSSSSPPNLKPPVSTDTPNNTLSCCNCHNQLCKKVELVGGKEAKIDSGHLHNHVFQQVPSQREIEDAVSSLQQFMQAVSSSSNLQRISDSYDSRIVLSQGYKRLYDAFQLLQADPAIKRLVISLSSDKAIWDAVMSNVLHQRLPELPNSACRRPQISEQKEFDMRMFNWILDIIKGKILELVESFLLLLNDIFQFPGMKSTTTDPTGLDEKVRSSLLLSIVILFIVIMTRSQKF